MPTWNKRRLLWGLFIVLFVAAALPCIHAWQQTGKYPDRLWLHRANSLEKWEEFSALYPNAEIDITVREGAVLDVTHDEPVSFGLCADRYIQALAHNDRRLWLDIKNLPPNATRVIERLDSMLALAQADRTRLIIERDNAEALRLFKQRGYYTSYYVRYDNPSQLTPAELATALNQLRKVVDSGQVSALSFPIHWYATLHEQLHRPEIDLLTWDHHTRQWTFLLLPWKRALLNDPQVKVILLKKKGSHHR